MHHGHGLRPEPHASLGSISISSGRIGLDSVSATAAEPGFIFYVAGHQFMMQMPTLPAAGTVWALRTYTGAVNGGNGAAGNIGPYSFSPATRPFTAVGASATATLTPNNVVVAATKGDLSTCTRCPTRTTCRASTRRAPTRRS